MARKTTKSATKSKARKEKDAEFVFRVLPLAFALRDGIARHRATAGNNLLCIEGAVLANLPSIVKSLRSFGFGADHGRIKKYRLPLSVETIQALKQGSEAVGLPMTDLLSLCLAPLAERPKSRR
jgi:hypothetical protein